MAKALQVATTSTQADINFERAVLEGLPEYRRIVLRLMSEDLFNREITDTALADMKAAVRDRLAPFEVTDEDFNAAGAAMAKLLRHVQETSA